MISLTSRFAAPILCNTSHPGAMGPPTIAVNTASDPQRFASYCIPSSETPKLRSQVCMRTAMVRGLCENLMAIFDIAIDRYIERLTAEA